ncbi:hypothetical protein [Variovorax sp. KK3]|uniref:hypothetical protein n=1 Tax=Variovorax sp. KK3 TaxID=1855728 RepID=UPI00117EF6DD|nr:hypothetical protein [Variovorax sp. KK3]
MKKPELNIPGVPYNFDAIPLWIEPALWDIATAVRFRRTKIAAFYCLSGIAATTVVCLPMYLWLGISNGFSSTRALGIWLPWAMSIAFTPVYGLGVLWDFVKAKREAERVTRLDQ